MPCLPNLGDFAVILFLDKPVITSFWDVPGYFASSTHAWYTASPLLLYIDICAADVDILTIYVDGRFSVYNICTTLSSNIELYASLCYGRNM